MRVAWHKQQRMAHMNSTDSLLAGQRIGLLGGGGSGKSGKCCRGSRIT